MKMSSPSKNRQVRTFGGFLLRFSSLLFKKTSGKKLGENTAVKIARCLHRTSVRFIRDQPYYNHYVDIVCGESLDI